MRETACCTARCFKNGNRLLHHVAGKVKQSVRIWKENGETTIGKSNTCDRKRAGAQTMFDALKKKYVIDDAFERVFADQIQRAAAVLWWAERTNGRVLGGENLRA